MNERIQEVEQLNDELAHLIVRKTTEDYDGTRD